MWKEMPEIKISKRRRQQRTRRTLHKVRTFNYSLFSSFNRILHTNYQEN